jgi:hypothetical protein
MNPGRFTRSHQALYAAEATEAAALSARYPEAEYQWMAGTLIRVLKECR